MELYDKKFLVYVNCMIRSFGKPGYPTKQYLSNNKQLASGNN